MKAKKKRSRLVLPGVCAGLSFQKKKTVYNACCKPWVKRMGENGTLVPLLTSAVSAPWCPSDAGASMLHTKPFPRQ